MNKSKIKYKRVDNEDEFGKDGGFGEEEDQGENIQELIIYWRFDDCRSNNILDYSNCKNNGQIISNNDDFFCLLEEGDPMEINDQWGQKCSNQYSIDFKNFDSTNIKSLNSISQFNNLSQFTFELWVKPRLKNSNLVEIGDS